MAEDLVAIEIAEKQWSDFLQEKEVYDSFKPKDVSGLSGDDLAKAESKNAEFKRITRAIQKGIVEIDENGIITQNLKYPIRSKDDKDKVIVGKLVFGYRWTANDRENVFKGIDSKDPSQALLAQRRLTAILTGVDLAILQRVDVDDLKITDILVSVFLM